MVDYTKFSDWVFTELPNLPAQQTIAGDELVVIRGGVPYRYDPVTRLGYADMAGNALETTINTVDVWESIAGVLVASGAEQGLTFAANVFTVTAETSLDPVRIKAGVTMHKDAGGAGVNIEVGIFVNGSQVGVGSTDTVATTQFGNAYVAVPAILANGDTVEIKVRNRTDADSLTVTEMSFGIG